MTPTEKASTVDRLRRAIIEHERLEHAHQKTLQRLQFATQANIQLQSQLREALEERDSIKEHSDAKKLRLRVAELTSEVLIWQRKWNAERQHEGGFR